MRIFVTAMWPCFSWQADFSQWYKFCLWIREWLSTAFLWTLVTMNAKLSAISHLQGYQTQREPPAINITCRGKQEERLAGTHLLPDVNVQGWPGALLFALPNLNGLLGNVGMRSREAWKESLPQSLSKQRGVRQPAVHWLCARVCCFSGTLASLENSLFISDPSELLSSSLSPTLASHSSAFQLESSL